MATSIHSVVQANPTVVEKKRFYKVQARVWVQFDPTNAEFSDVAEAIEQGTGFLTMMEVIHVVQDSEEIDDPEVKERFADLRAAERILRNRLELPNSLREKLRSALGTQHEETPS